MAGAQKHLYHSLIMAIAPILFFANSVSAKIISVPASLAQEDKEWVLFFQSLLSKDELKLLHEINYLNEFESLKQSIYERLDTQLEGASSKEITDDHIRFIKEQGWDYASGEDERVSELMKLGAHHPARTPYIRCSGLRPIQIWEFSTRSDDSNFLIFVGTGFGRRSHFRLWNPQDGFDSLTLLDPRFRLASETGTIQVEDPYGDNPNGDHFGASDMGGSPFGPSANMGANSVRNISQIASLCSGNDADELRRALRNITHSNVGNEGGLQALAAQSQQSSMIEHLTDLDPSRSKNKEDKRHFCTTKIPPFSKGSFDGVEVLVRPKMVDSNHADVEVNLVVPKTSLALQTLDVVKGYTVVVCDEVIKDSNLFEKGVTDQFTFDSQKTPGDKIPLQYIRRLRFGDYKFFVLIRDVGSDKFFRGEIPIHLSADELIRNGGKIAGAPIAVQPSEKDSPAATTAVTEAKVANTILLDPVPGGWLTGPYMVRAQINGIEAVKFYLAGKFMFTKKLQPQSDFVSASLSLGNEVKTQTLAVVGLDAKGRAVAADQVVINDTTAASKFSVRLQEPLNGNSYSGATRARAVIQIPNDQALKTVEFSNDDKTVGSFQFSPPDGKRTQVIWKDSVRQGSMGKSGTFTQSIPIASVNKPTSVTVRATLTNGDFKESTALINGTADVENVDYVELLATITDRHGRRIDPLKIKNIKIFENDKEQPISGNGDDDLVASAKSVPATISVLLDTSSSMYGLMDTMKVAVSGFLKNLLTPTSENPAQNKASLLSFDSRINIESAPTYDLYLLEQQLMSLYPKSSTHLYDALITGLRDLNAATGPKALVLFSDGWDDKSNISFENALTYAHKAQVVIYTIGLRKKKTDVEKQFQKFSEATGGRHFVFDETAKESELAEVYNQISTDLRSRYVIPYQSTNTDPGYRNIRVQLQGLLQDARVQTRAGYLP